MHVKAKTSKSESDPIDSCPEDLKTIPERVFCRLREEIVEGRIKAGSKISEAELAQTYGISRGPLREAISRLSAVGLIERKPNIGARIIELSSERLLEIFHVREALEGMAARQAAENISPEALQHLRDTLQRHAGQIEQDEEQAYFQQTGDLDFHYQIVQASGNQQLVKLLCHDLYHLVRMYRYQFSMRSKRGLTALAEHGHIVAAIERGDAEMAELLMRSHIRTSRQNVERMLA